MYISIYLLNNLANSPDVGFKSLRNLPLQEIKNISQILKAHIKQTAA